MASTVVHTAPQGNAHWLATDELVKSWAALVLGHEPWSWMVTLTTRRGHGEEELRKRYLELVADVDRKVLGLEPGANLWAAERVRWCCAWERQARGAWHLHALWSSPRLTPACSDPARALWTRSAPPAAPGSSGRIIEEEAHGIRWLVDRYAPPRGQRRAARSDWAWVSHLRHSAEGAAHYVCKYVSKGGFVDCDGLT